MTTGMMERTVEKRASDTSPSGVMRMFDFSIWSLISGDDVANLLP